MARSSHLLFGALLALAVAQQEECRPSEGDCHAESASALLQKTRGRGVVKTEEVEEEGASAVQTDDTGLQDSRSCTKHRNVVIFMDGTRKDLGVKCKWLPEKLCESNIAMLYRLSKEISPAQQVAYYEPGVGARDFLFNVEFGTDTKYHMLNAYNWLSENYQSCDQVMLFGFSRGALQGRMLQGMLNRVGLAKRGHATEAEAAHFDRDNSIAKNFKASNKAWRGVKVKFFGMFDGVLRTLMDPIHHQDLARYHMQMTPVVENFAHAIAMGDYHEFNDAAEIYTAPGTNATQAYFIGMHGDVGGGGEIGGGNGEVSYANRALANIPGGWMADQAAAAGLLLPSGWRERPELSVDYLGDAITEMGLDAGPFIILGLPSETILGTATVRNPARCRKEMGKANQKILIHQSVQDRMNANQGWVPLQWCCTDVKKAMDAVGYEFITNEHYRTRKAAGKTPPWFKLSFRWLKNAELSETSKHISWDHPEYFLKVTNWHDKSSKPPPPAAGAPSGCCHAVEVKPKKAPSVKTYKKSECTYKIWGVCVAWSLPHYRADQDFQGLEVVLPYEDYAADRVMLELHEKDWVTDHDYLGRGYIKYSEFGTDWRTLSLGNGATLEVRADPFHTDKEAAVAQGGQDYAQCLWMDKASGLPRSTMCESSGVVIPLIPNPFNPRDCAGFIEDTKTGAL